ncbi:hypothetical protein EVG20_g8499 [Dentipellis fragilis]|uniref:Uncharacterized protein n=1 Tax=Dentipellis fragilis TaxID=205917 RepID=A0A4Y9Y5X6_9AGAM|nr:hypothetical protein EVG20_g8499 [Dentipellis fragilis]
MPGWPDSGQNGWEISRSSNKDCQLGLGKMSHKNQSDETLRSCTTTILQPVTQSMVTSSSLAHIPRAMQPPVYRLPPEILSMIFLAFQYTEGALLVPARSDAPHRTPWQESMGAPAWTDVLFICRFWREVALGCSYLWARLVDPSIQWAQECLRLSTAVPMTLRLNAEEGDKDAERARAFAAIVFSGSIDRLQKLSVRVQTYEALTNIIFALMNGPAPLLEYLCLDKDSVMLEEGGGVGKDPELRLDPWFEGRTPKLRKLRIQAAYCFLSLASPMFSSLTYLRICISGGEGMDDLLTAMGNWKQLETLILAQSWPGAVEPDPHNPLPLPTRSIELPNLQQLRVRDTAFSVQCFLGHLLIPASTLLDIDGTVYPLDGEPHQPRAHEMNAMQELLSSIPPTIMAPITDMYLLPSADKIIIDVRPEAWGRGFTLDQGGDPDEDEDEDIDTLIDGPFETKLHIAIARFSHPDDDDDVSEIRTRGYLEAVFIGSHFSGLRNLILDVCWTYSVYTWAEVFKTLNNLQGLAMLPARHHTTEELVKTLALRISTDGVNEHLILPNLSKLALWQPTTRFQASAQENLLMVLRSRHLYSGSRLAKLRVSGLEDFETATLIELRYHTAFLY